jgi:UDP-glucose 4-epimerase
MVFHLAEYIPETTLYGVGHVIRYSVNKPLQDFDVGCKGTLNLLEMCRKHDKPIVFSSTAAVYGNGYINPIKEDAPTIPVSPYGASKLCAETYIALYSRLYGLQTDILRFFNVYGPKQRKYLIFDLLLKLRSDPTRLEVKGTGEERRDFIYVADAVDSLLIVTSKRERGIICNVGTGGSYSVSQVVNLTIRSLGLKPAITYTGASWKGDINCLVADNERLLGFGFAPKWSLKQGIRETIRWFAEYSKTKPD